jgi:DNA-directed RNA polymerase specialized sigma24 family protein
MLGSVSEADDAVREALLLSHRSDVDDVENLTGWLMTVVGRISRRNASRRRPSQPAGFRSVRQAGLSRK